MQGRETLQIHSLAEPRSGICELFFFVTKIDMCQNSGLVSSVQMNIRTNGGPILGSNVLVQENLWITPACAPSIVARGASRHTAALVSIASSPALPYA